MSDRVDQRPSRALALVRRLREVVTEFDAASATLTRELRTRERTIERTHREAVEKLTETLEAGAVDSEAVLSDAGEKLRNRHAARRDRIEHARKEAIRLLPKRVREERARWIGELQLREFEAGRWLTARRDEADKAFANFLAELANQERALAALERRARAYFAGSWRFLRLLRTEEKAESPAGEPNRIYGELAGEISRTEAALAKFRTHPLPRMFSLLPLPVWWALIGLAAFLLADSEVLNPAVAIGGALAGSVIFTVLHEIGKRRSREDAVTVANHLHAARRLAVACRTAAETTHTRDIARSEHEHSRAAAEIAQELARADTVSEDFRRASEKKLEVQVPRAAARNDAILQAGLDRIASEIQLRDELTRQGADAARIGIERTREEATATLAADANFRWQALEEDWRKQLVPLYRAIAEIETSASEIFPPWSEEFVGSWQPPVLFTPATFFARLEFSLKREDSPRLALPGPAEISVPLALSYPDEGSLLIESNDSGAHDVTDTLNAIILRLLATTPPGKLSFTIIDPVGLGQNFAGLMHLADYEESLINRRIWTQREQIEERLAGLNEHIEKIIQMYLRNEYATIADYNERAGSTAEKYHFLVIADFPAHFSETAARRLASIIASGPRCGVFTLIHWDRRQPLPDGLAEEDLRKGSLVLRREAGTLVVDDPSFIPGTRLVLQPLPTPALALELVQRTGSASVDANRVQVPFASVAPDPGECWSGITTNELRVAIGRTGATKLQYLAIGKGTRQHALFAGKTGSGKSTLFHVIITNLALWCSPEQVEFYLIDFKKGVEFKCYAEKRLPHARVVAIESDREFGLSVLQRLDEELRRRGDLFRRAGAQDVAGYLRGGGTEPMPRSLLIIDEFQEFFVEDDTIAQNAAVLLDRIVRQGRAFGIHVLLGSQTLGGAFTLARATLGQMVIRVALQCNEADAYLIMDDSNSAPRLLSRPGEGIYNDAAGAVEGNSPFQVVWLPDDERDARLDEVRALAERRTEPLAAPVVFEGNAPADVRDNSLLAQLLATEPERQPTAARVWLGAPNAIKGPTEAIFHRQSGNHLLIAGQRDDATLTMLGLALLALAAQYSTGAAQFVFFHQYPPGSVEADFLAAIRDAAGHDVVFAGASELPGVMANLATELHTRGEDGALVHEAPAVFVFIHGLQRFKKLRSEDSFDFSFGEPGAEASPAAHFGELINEGSSHGLHLLVAVDTFNNVNRSLSRKALGEFEMRVIFQMSANDSASLIDSPKASGLGLHRALFYNEHDGTLETFRPYGMPDAAWIGQAAPAAKR